MSTFQECPLLRIMFHQTTLMELMAKVGGRDNPGKFFATQGQRDRLGQVAASTRHKDALGLALGVSGELQIVPLGKPLTGCKHQLHRVPGRCQDGIDFAQYDCIWKILSPTNHLCLSPDSAW